MPVSYEANHQEISHSESQNVSRKGAERAGGQIARESDFRNDYQAWKETWKETIERRSVYMDGSTHYTHQRLRAAMHSLDFYLPYLFTCQREGCKGMPNTNNKIEGTFTDLKKNLNNHSGLTMENRKRFIAGFFLALMETLSMKKQEPH